MNYAWGILNTSLPATASYTCRACISACKSVNRENAIWTWSSVWQIAGICIGFDCRANSGCLQSTETLSGLHWYIDNCHCGIPVLSSTHCMHIKLVVADSNWDSIWIRTVNPDLIQFEIQFALEFRVPVYHVMLYHLQHNGLSPFPIDPRLFTVTSNCIVDFPLPFVTYGPVSCCLTTLCNKDG